MSSVKPRIDRVEPEDLWILREVDPRLPAMEGDGWRGAWDGFFRAAHQGMCWLASVSEKMREERNRSEADAKTRDSAVGFLAAQRQFFGGSIVTAISVRAGCDRSEITAALLRLLESRCRGETVYVALPAEDEDGLMLLTELGYEKVGSLNPPSSHAGVVFVGKMIGERPTKSGASKSASQQAGDPGPEAEASTTTSAGDASEPIAS